MSAFVVARTGIAVAPGCYKVGVNGNCVRDYHLRNESVVYYEFRVYNYDNHSKGFVVYTEGVNKDSINIVPKTFNLGQYQQGEQCGESEGCKRIIVAVHVSKLYTGNYSFPIIIETLTGGSVLSLKQQVIARIQLGLVDTYEELNEHLNKQSAAQQIPSQEEFEKESTNITRKEKVVYTYVDIPGRPYWHYILFFTILVLVIAFLMLFFLPIKLKRYLKVKGEGYSLLIIAKNISFLRLIHNFVIVCTFKDPFLIKSVNVNNKPISLIRADAKKKNTFNNLIENVIKHSTAFHLDKHLIIFCKGRLKFNKSVNIEVKFSQEDFEEDFEEKPKREFIHFKYYILEGLSKALRDIDLKILYELEPTEIEAKAIRHHDYKGLLKLMRKELKYLYLDHYLLCAEALKILVKNKRFKRFHFLLRIYENLVREHGKK